MRKRKSKYLWMAVETDEYELPLAVADTARELGDIVGVTKHNIESFIAKNCSGKYSKWKYVKVWRDESDDTDDTI